MPGAAHRGVSSIKVVEIVKIVGPQVRSAMARPIRRIRTNALKVEEAKPIGRGHRRRRTDWDGIGMGQCAQRRRRTLVGPRSAQREPYASDDLPRTQIPQRVKVMGEATQCCAASLTAMVARLISRISSSGIGDASPALIALTKAATQALWPLSCRHSRCDLKRGQPKARNRRKLSSCNMRPPANTSTRSLGKDA